MSENEFAVCPYNPQHRLIKFRMPGHMIKCERNYRGPPLETCIYNAQHMVPVGSMAKHLLTCEAHLHFHSDGFLRQAEALKN